MLFVFLVFVCFVAGVGCWGVWFIGFYCSWQNKTNNDMFFLLGAAKLATEDLVCCVLPNCINIVLQLLVNDGILTCGSTLSCQKFTLESICVRNWHLFLVVCFECVVF